MSNNILMMDNRQLIPRWHTSRKIYKFNFPDQFKSAKKSHFVEDFWFLEAVEKWKENPSKQNALDVFVRFIQEDERNHPIYHEVHRQLLDQYDELLPAAKNLVCPELKLIDNLDGYSTDPQAVRLIIGKLRNIVKFNPRDSLTWMDLGFYYSVIGEMEKAKYCVNISQNLEPEHAFIARSYTRFLVHIGEPDKAVWYLKRRQQAKTNPLILSACTAIASAFDIEKPNIKNAISLIEHWSGHKAKISELAACIGTIEISNGASKKGKRLIQMALDNPSENVVSHVQWLHLKHNIVFKNMPKPTDSIEGGVNSLYKLRKFEECRQKLLEMHQFQPYSAAPIVDAGYLSISALDDPAFVIQISDKRVPRSHMSFGELNNLIVAKLQTEDFSNIDVDLRILGRRCNTEDPRSVATYRATAGMALLKSGFVEEGVKLYDDAIRILQSHKMHHSLCLAKSFYSKQLESINPERSVQLKNESKKLANQYGILEMQ